MKELDKLATAVVAVMQEVKGMEKNSTVGYGRNSYDGTKDEDVKAVFNEKMAKHGLCIIPTGVSEETELSSWMDGDKRKQSVFTKVVTEYMLIHTSGQSMKVAGYGHGVDTQDKGAGKATTYALKNALLNLFLTPVGRQPDTDTTHSDDIEVPPKKKPVYPVGRYPKAAKGIKEGETTFEMIETMFSLTTEAKKEIEELVKTLK